MLIRRPAVGPFKGARMLTAHRAPFPGERHLQAAGLFQVKSDMRRALHNGVGTCNSPAFSL
jgi:hypothetical protein